MWEGTTSRVTVADRPYGEFYDFYSVSLENFGYHLVYDHRTLTLLSALKVIYKDFAEQWEI